MNNSPATRFVGIDLHKHFAVVAAVDARQSLVLRPTHRIPLDDFPAWAQTHLFPTDAVVLESTSNAWWLYDILAPLVARTVVASPLHVTWIANAAVKTDKRDAIRLAKLLAAHLIPEVWVPPPPVRELRALLAHRRALVKQRTAAKNRLHSVLHRHPINPPTGDLFAAHNRDGWLTLDLPSTERLRTHQDLATPDHLEQLLADLDAEFARLRCHKPQGVAIVAIARKLLVAIWRVLSERVADCHAEPAMVACKLMRWSWELTDEQRGGLTSRQFVRYGLLRLGLGNDLTGFTYGGMPRALASVEEILARFPELAPPA